MPLSGENSQARYHRTATKMEPAESNEKIPLFLVKLWKIVEDPNFRKIVCWDETGFSFHILDPYSFCKSVLPQFFKHNNLNSLIRQLNMYGFRKMTPIERSGLSRAESDHEHLEFQHPYFVRGHPDLLGQIKRKVTGSTAPKVEPATFQAGSSSRQLGAVLDEVRQLRDKQATMEGNLGHLLKENRTLWREVAHMRNLHMKQQQVVNKLISFLISVLQPSGQKRLGKRQLLAIGPDEVDPKRSHQLFNSPTSVEALSLLQQELTDGASTSGANGPIIADVTEELDRTTPGGSRINDSPMMADGVSLANDHLWQPEPNYSMPSSSNAAQPTQYNQPTMYSVGGDPSALPGASQLLPPLSQSGPRLEINAPFNSPPYFDKYVMPAFPSNDFGDYLNTMDLNLDNCRDALISGGYNLDSEQLNDIFSMCEQTPVEELEGAGSIVGNELTLYQAPHSLVEPMPTDPNVPQNSDPFIAPDSETQQATALVEAFNREQEEEAEKPEKTPSPPSALVTPLVSPMVKNNKPPNFPTKGGIRVRKKK